MPCCFCIPKKKSYRTKNNNNQARIEEDEWSDDEIESKKKNIPCIIC